jgi:cell division protein FtsB
MADVADLVVQMHSNIDSIHQCVQTLSDTASHDAEMEKLEQERESRIAEIQSKHEK